MVVLHLHSHNLVSGGFRENSDFMSRELMVFLQSDSYRLWCLRYRCEALPPLGQAYQSLNSLRIGCCDVLRRPQ